MNRREFLAASAGLTVALCLGDVARAADATFEPDAWIRITPDDMVTFVLDKAEMGQGVLTGLAMLVAEELRVAPASLNVVFAPPGRAYINHEEGFQITGDSTSTSDGWTRLREAGAGAREALVRAAARRWRVRPEDCTAADGRVTSGSNAATYGELAADAARSGVPRGRLTPAGEWRVIGTSVPRLDIPAKVRGEAVFGIDVAPEGVRIAVVARPPTLLGTVEGFDATQALAMPGVRAVVGIDRGVAVVADTYWQGRQALSALAVTWGPGPHAGLDSDALALRYRDMLSEAGRRITDDGDFTAAQAAATDTIEATYELPFCAHATMEPQNCTVHVTGDRCEIWAPTQSPGIAMQVAIGVTGLPARRIDIHTTFLGGGFGRRIPQDYIHDALQIGVQVDGPVKLVFSREDDLAIDFYRPATANLLKATVGADGDITGWFHRIVSQNLRAWIGTDIALAAAPSWLPRGIRRGIGRGLERKARQGKGTAKPVTEGAADVPYAVPARRVEWVAVHPGIPVGYWRSVANFSNAFAIESFVDEVAHRLGVDPLALRRRLLGTAPRNLAVLDLAADKAGWSDPVAEGRFRGIAQHESFGTCVAMVAEVSVAGPRLRVHRVVCAVDCGQVVNPAIVTSQLQSGVVFGLSAALKQHITFEAGRVVQQNFWNFDAVRMHEMPEVEVHIVPSTNPPTGVGEPGVPVIGPAVCNAIFAATGTRIRRLPIEGELS